MDFSNYGIKRMLPRLIIAAILVNISFYICQIAVDLSNIIGQSIYSFFSSGINIGTSGAGVSWVDTVSGPSGILALASGLLAALLVLVFVGPIALFALGVTLLILIARQAFIVLLIVVSPLAFVAYLLPNTEQWFKKWRVAFTSLLMVYPIVGAIFGASYLASKILADTNDKLMSVVALGVMAIPLFAVPGVLKGAMAAAGTIGTKLAGYQDRANRGVAKGIKEGRLGEAKTAFDARRQARAVNRRLGEGRISKVGQKMQERGWVGGKTVQVAGSLGSRFDRTRAGRYVGGERGAAAATAELHKAFDEEVGRQKTLMTSAGDDELLGIVQDEKASVEKRSAAAGMIMKGGSMESIHKLLDSSAGIRNVETRSTVQKQMAGDMSRTPFGLGSSDQAALRRGEYRGNYQQKLAERVQQKMSADGLAALDPDDRKAILKMTETDAGKELLGDAGFANLSSAIRDARKNSNIWGRVQADAQADFAEIESVANTRNQQGSTPPQPPR